MVAVGSDKEVCHCELHKYIVTTSPFTDKIAHCCFRIKSDQKVNKILLGTLTLC